MYAHPEIIEGLTANGVKSRFKKGSKGRTRDKLSLQELKRLKSSIRKQTPEMIENCRQLGKSGVGNVVRWGKKEE